MDPNSFLSDYMVGVESEPVAMTPDERSRHREEARLIYDMIRKGEIPNPGEATMKQLMDQISGVVVKGV